MRRFLPPLALLAATAALAGSAPAQPTSQSTVERSTAQLPPPPFNLPASVTTGRLTVVGQGEAVPPAGPEPESHSAPPPPFNLPASVTTPALSVVGQGAASNP